MIDGVRADGVRTSGARLTMAELTVPVLTVPILVALDPTVPELAMLIGCHEKM